MMIELAALLLTSWGLLVLAPIVMAIVDHDWRRR